VTARGWLIITRDRNIQGHRAEIDAVILSQARLVAIAGDDGASKWGQLEVVMNQWRAIERFLELPGPWIYTATRTALSRCLGPALNGLVYLGTPTRSRHGSVTSTSA